MSYKHTLFEKTFTVESSLSSLEGRQYKKKHKELEGLLDELYVNGWRQEYDLWCQTSKD